MKIFTKLFGAALLLGGLTAQAQDIYISGDFNNNNPDGNPEWQLNYNSDYEDDGYDYSKEFDIEAGELSFYFIQGEKYLIPPTTVDLTFNSENSFTSSYMEYDTPLYSWENDSYGAGTLRVELNTEESTLVVKFYESGFDEPSEIWYLRGEFNNYAPNGNAKWALEPVDDPEQNGVYSGTFEIPANKFSLNLENPYGTVFIPASLSNEDVEFTNDIFFSKMDYADPGDEDITWNYPGWKGGEIEITIDANEGDVTIKILSESTDVPSASEMYVSGLFNGYNPDGDSEWKLRQGDPDDDEDDNLYTGYFYFDADTFSLNIQYGSEYLVPTNGDEILDFANGPCTSSYTISEDGDYYWEYPTFKGGNVDIQVNTIDETITFYYTEPAPEYWYIRGVFNDYDPDGDETWALVESSNPEENGTYSGTFTIPAGKLEFNLLAPNGNVFIPMDITDEELEFTKNIYNGFSDYAFDDREEAYVWYYTNWGGGEVTVTIDANSGELTVEILSEYPDIYISGAFNNYDPAAEYKLTPDEDSVYLYSGYFEVPAGEFSFNFTYGEDTYLLPAILPGLASSKDVTVVFNDNDFTGEIAEGENEVYWVNEDWTGGQVGVLINLEDMTVTLQAEPASEEPVAEVWYIRGTFNDFAPAGEEKWALNPVADEEENGVYSGKFEVPAGVLTFNLLSPEGTVFIPASIETEEMTFTDNVFTGLMDYAYDESEEAYTWTYEGWQGGEVTVTIDANSGELTVEIPEQTSGINSILNDSVDTIYNLQGVKVSKDHLTKGIYIINGKKVLVK